MNKLYHGSVVDIEGNYLMPMSTDEFGDNKKYVFAIEGKVFPLLFMAKKMQGFGVFGNNEEDGEMIYVENYENEFRDKYVTNGFLYLIDSDGFFHHEKSTFKPEYVSLKKAKMCRMN